VKLCGRIFSLTSGFLHYVAFVSNDIFHNSAWCLPYERNNCGP